MQNISDTIIACSSPLGRGAISLVRISGPDLTFLSQKLKIKNLVNKKAIVKEIQELNTQIATKRELGLKVQGIIEYLEQTGVKLPEEEAPAAEAEAPTEEPPRPEEEVADTVAE